MIPLVNLVLAQHGAEKVPTRASQIYRERRKKLILPNRNFPHSTTDDLRRKKSNSLMVKTGTQTSTAAKQI